MRQKPHMVICDELGITLLGPPDASLARIKFVERTLKSSLRGLARGLNRSRIPQMKGFKVVVDFMEAPKK